MDLRNLFLLALCVLVFGITNCQNRDETRVPGASGPGIVSAVIDLIRETCIFPDDWQFVRRIAYVATNDGQNLTTFGTGFDGGIWQINETFFNYTRTAPELSAYRADIFQNFGINWTTSQWLSLRQPLFGALSAFLYVSQLSTNGGIPNTVEKQAAFWGTDNGKQANEFVKAVGKLNETACRTMNEVDLVFVLDSSASMSETDFNTIKQSVVNVISEMDIAPGRVRVAAVAFSNIVFAHFNLTAHDTKSDVISAVNAIKYQAGGTNTDQALDYINQNILTSAAGSRDDASKVVIVFTDGRADNLVNTITAADALKKIGVQIFAVGIGNSINKMELTRIASEPECTHVRQVASVNDLSTLTYDLQQIACKAAIELRSGTYNFSCSAGVNAVVVANSQAGTTLTLTPVRDTVELYGIVSAKIAASSVLYNFKDVASPGNLVQLYIRDNTPVSLLVRSTSTGTCRGYFTMQITDGDNIRPDISNVTCVESALVSSCTTRDLITSSYLLLTPAGSEFASLCPPGQEKVIPHPTVQSHFLYCNGSATLLGYCPPTDVFDSQRGRCVPSQQTTTAPSSGPTTTQISGQPPATQPQQPAPTRPYQNQTGINLYAFCTPGHISQGLLTYPYPFNSSRYIKCYGFPVGIGTILNCPENKYYSHSERTCLYNKVVVNATLHEFSGQDNPCQNPPTQLYFPHLDPHKFIQCDNYGDAFIKTCDRNEVWEQEILQCIPKGFEYQTRDPSLVGRK